MNYVITTLNYWELLSILEKHYIIIEDKNDYDTYKTKLEVTNP